MKFYCVFIIYEYTDRDLRFFTKTTKSEKINLSWKELGENKDTNAVFTLLENKIKSMYFNNTGPDKYNKHISLQYFFET